MAGMKKTVDKTVKKETQTQERQRVIDMLADELANSDRSLWEICESLEGMPTARTVARWIAEDADLCQRYARGKELQADFMAAQIRTIADECRIGTKTVEKASGTETTTGDMVERSRLQIDARKWLAGKLAPKKYGDKITQEISGVDGGPIKIHEMTEDELIAIATGRSN